MIYLQKFNEGIFKRKSNNAELDDNGKLLLKSFNKTEAYKLISKRLKSVAGINTKILSDVSDIIIDEYNLSKYTRGIDELKLYLPNSNDLVITIYSDKAKDRRLFYKDKEQVKNDLTWFVFRIFISEKRNDCLVIKVHNSYINKFLLISPEKQAPEKQAPETPVESAIKKQYEPTPSEVNELLIRFSTFSNVILDKYSKLFDINMFIIEKISNMVCSQYSLYVKRVDLVSNFSQFYDSMPVLIISKEISKDRIGFYMEGDWYVFRIFVCTWECENKYICLSVKVHKTYLNDFLNRKIKKDPWGDSQYENDPVVNKYTPTKPVVNTYIPPAKKDNIDEMKALMKKIKNKKMNK